MIQLIGSDASSKRALGQKACAALGMPLYVLDARILPTDIHELDTWKRAWERQAALNSYALIVEADEFDSMDSSRSRALIDLVEQTAGALLVACLEHQTKDGRVRCRAVLAHDLQQHVP